MPPAEPFSYGTWPSHGRASRVAGLGCLGLVAAGVAFIAIAATIALFRGHLEAILWAAAPWLMLWVAFHMPLQAARCDGAVLAVPSFGGRETTVPLVDVTTIRAGRWSTPIVVVESATRLRPVRLYTSTSSEQFIARLREVLSPGVDQLPTESNVDATPPSLLDRAGDPVAVLRCLNPASDERSCREADNG